MLRKLVPTLMCVLLALAVALTAGACGKQSYGEAYNSLGELRQAMEEAQITFSYPTYMGETNAEPTKAFVSVLEPKSGETEGYKIYSFGTPFFVCVAAYKEDGGVVKSDNAARLTKEENLATAKGEAQLYTGKGHKDALFLIGTIVLDGRRYEVRVNSDKVTANNNFVNAIYKDNAKYAEALDLLRRVIEGLQQQA